MPETPNFEQIARRLVDSLDGDARDQFDDDAFVLRIAEQLRLVWNARGAADIAKIGFAFMERTPKSFDRELRSLDR